MIPPKPSDINVSGNRAQQQESSSSSSSHSSAFRGRNIKPTGYGKVKKGRSGDAQSLSGVLPSGRDGPIFRKRTDEVQYSVKSSSHAENILPSQSSQVQDTSDAIEAEFENLKKQNRYKLPENDSLYVSINEKLPNTYDEYLQCAKNDQNDAENFEHLSYDEWKKGFMDHVILINNNHEKGTCNSRFPSVYALEDILGNVDNYSKEYNLPDDTSACYWQVENEFHLAKLIVGFEELGLWDVQEFADKRMDSISDPMIENNEGLAALWGEIKGLEEGKHYKKKYDIAHGALSKFNEDDIREWIFSSMGFIDQNSEALLNQKKDALTQRIVKNFHQFKSFDLGWMPSAETIRKINLLIDSKNSAQSSSSSRGQDTA